MSNTDIQLWKSSGAIILPDSISDPIVISSVALQLREREQTQIATNIRHGNYEMASTYVWTRTMALLKKQLSNLGMEFLGELLQRPDIDGYSEAVTALSDSEAISLARDLGMLTKVQTMRFMHSQEVVAHFSAIDNDPAGDHLQEMTHEEAISCLRVCVQGVLGHEQITVAEDFKQFRLKLETETLTSQSNEFIKLSSSPYFFLKTAVSILLALFKTTKSAQLEHTARNAALIIPAFWQELKAPEKWQIGQTYAELFNDGRKDSLMGLHSVLVAVNGFDFVPENLRSATFIKVASNVISAHQAMNNFYNEPAPMRELASLGTSIPSPALGHCITAALCVRLGNPYGIAHAAQDGANQILSGLSNDRWYYYLNDKLVQDRVILSKFRHTGPRRRWMNLVGTLGLDPKQLPNKGSSALLQATNDQNPDKVKSIASTMLNQALGS